MGDARGSLLDLPDECLALIATSGPMTPGDRCLLSTTCKRWRRLLPSERAVDGRACLLTFGFEKCRAMGCPADAPGVCNVFAEAGAAFDGDLMRAAEAGCPVGSAVAGEAAARGCMDMLIWAWRWGAALDASVAGRIACAPSNVVRWLALQGCPVEMGLADMVIMDNAESVAAVVECRRLGPGVWMRMMEMAKAAGSWGTVIYIAEALRLH